MIEHKVVVVFDVTAHDVLDAGRAVIGLLNGTRSQYLLPGGLAADSKIESWWMPEEPLRSEVDRNDNAHGRLVFDLDEREASHADLVLLTSYMASQHYTPDAIAYAVEKPWKHTDLLAVARDELAAQR